MKVQSLDGKVETLKYLTRRKSTSRISDLHQRSMRLLTELFQGYQIFEEVEILIQHRKKLYLDIFIPNWKIAVEVNGKQHFYYTPIFHKNKQGFVLQRKNDMLKYDWCELNNIKIIPFNYNEDESIWTAKINMAIKEA